MKKMEAKLYVVETKQALNEVPFGQVIARVGNVCHTGDIVELSRRPPEGLREATAKDLSGLPALLDQLAKVIRNKIASLAPGDDRRRALLWKRAQELTFPADEKSFEQIIELADDDVRAREVVMACLKRLNTLATYLPGKPKK